MVCQFGNMGARRRVGCWLEILGFDSRQVSCILKSISPTKAVIPLVPGKVGKGKVDSRWGVLVNLEAKDVEKI